MNSLENHPVLNSLEVHCMGQTSSGRSLMEIWLPSEDIPTRVDVYDKICNIHIHLLERSPLEVTGDGFSFTVVPHEGLEPGMSALAEIGFYVKENFDGIGVYLKDIYDIYPTNKDRPTQVLGNMLESFTFGPLDAEASRPGAQPQEWREERPKRRVGTPAPLLVASVSSERSEAPLPPSPPPMRREGAPLFRPEAPPFEPSEMPILCLDGTPEGACDS